MATDKFCHIVSCAILKAENELEVAASAMQDDISYFCLFDRKFCLMNIPACICICINI